MRDFLLEIADQLGALGPWADKTHLAPEDVPELRHLVYVEFSHEPADAQPSRIALGRPAHFAGHLGVQLHAADFVDEKLPPVAPHPSLPVKDRTGRFGIDDRAEDRDERN